jgi:hypothetical protein
VKLTAMIKRARGVRMGCYVESRDLNNSHRGVVKSPSPTRELAMTHACYLMGQHREIIRAISDNGEVVELAEIERFCHEKPSR